MAELTSLADAVTGLVRDGDTVALEGFTHLIPFAAGHELIRQERRAVFVEECRFLLVAVPPLAILVVLAIVGVSYTRIIQVIVFTGVLSLGVWVAWQGGGPA